MKFCVYTAITNGYETLNEQPVARGSKIPFICFSDDPAAVSESWELRKLEAVFPEDGARSQRIYKLLPQRFLSEYDVSLYIDNSVLLKVAPEEIFAAVEMGAGMALPAHSFRATVLDEFGEVALQRLDEPGRIGEQLTHYEKVAPESLAAAPFWCGILLRDHHNELVAKAMEIWLAHVLRYARRDQLSAVAAFAQAGLRPDVMRIDNYDSWLHSWPHVATRQVARRVWPEAETIFSFHGRQLMLDYERAVMRRQLAAVTRELDAVTASRSWKLTAPLRRLGGVLRRR